MAVQSSHDLHSMGQGFAGKRMLGYKRDPVMRTGEPTPAPEPPCPTCNRSVEAATCTTYRDGKTYRTTYRTCLSARKLRYGKTQPTCSVRVEEVEIHNEMANPTGKRPALDRTPDKADQAEWQRLKAALKLSNKHLIEASGVRSIALYDWFADRLVTQETESRIKAGLRKLQDQEAGLTHVPIDEASNWKSPTATVTEHLDPVFGNIVSESRRLKQIARDVLANTGPQVEQCAPSEPVEWPTQSHQPTIWTHAAKFEQIAKTMAERDIHIFRAVCQRVLEQVAK